MVSEIVKKINYIIKEVILIEKTPFAPSRLFVIYSLAGVFPMIVFVSVSIALLPSSESVGISKDIINNPVFYYWFFFFLMVLILPHLEIFITHFYKGKNNTLSQFMLYFNVEFPEKYGFSTTKRRIFFIVMCLWIAILVILFLLGQYLFLPLNYFALERSVMKLVLRKLLVFNGIIMVLMLVLGIEYNVLSYLRWNGKI